MQQYLNVYQNNPLFINVGNNDLLPLLECLHAKKVAFRKNDSIMREGDPAVNMGIVLSGRVNLILEDVFGGRSIMDSLESGQLFCEAFGCAETELLPVSVVAQTDCEVLLLNSRKVMHTCEKACEKHRTMVENMVRILAREYTVLNRKAIHLSGRTIRRKLLSYLSDQSRQSGSNSFSIPFDRQELADYLFIERSALSAELSKLRKEGVLEYNKKNFHLLAAEALLEDARFDSFSSK